MTKADYCHCCRSESELTYSCDICYCNMCSDCDMGGDKFFSANYGSGNLTDYEFYQRQYLVSCCPHNAARYDAHKLYPMLERLGKPNVKPSDLVSGIGRTQQIREGVRKHRIRDTVHPSSLRTKASYRRDRKTPLKPRCMRPIIPQSTSGYQPTKYKHTRTKKETDGSWK